MRRRTFLQSLGALFGLAAVPRVQTPAEQGLVYSDSEGTDPAILVVLSDGITTSGGIVYAA